MEVRINKEIRNYTEAMFFGLSLRQFAFSVLACVAAVTLYFLLKPHLALETVSWVCILGAVPFGVIGFIKYHGMTAEQFIWAWIKSEILLPKKIGFVSVNIYYAAIFDSKYKTKDKHANMKRRLKKSDKNVKKHLRVG